MNVLLRYFDERLGESPEQAGELCFEDPTPITARALIRQRVIQEVARHDRAVADLRSTYGTFRGLVTPISAPGAARRIDADAQVAIACAAFERNGFFLLVDDHQVEDLDEVLEFHPDMRVSFVRLLPLVGG